MRRIWLQFMALGLPRCSEVWPKQCGHLIWPWQNYVFGFEDGPFHHSCHHRHLEYMYASMAARDDESDLARDLYGECGHCGQVIK